ncbi:MAG TPA: hypothetical protein VJR27_00235 [Candidatus Saccharimonadales bacterium]|nr:hypothetical protein [Candidatus Saccharimonadales bacterium]
MNKTRSGASKADLASILATQQHDGRFTVLNLKTDGQVAIVNSAVLLLHAQLLDALCQIDNTQNARQRLAQWLVTAIAKEPFQNPKRVSAQATFEVLASLGAYDQTTVPKALLAHAIRYLVDHEIVIGGPYKNHDGTVDLATNIAITRFVRFVAQPLPKLDAYIQRAAQEPLPDPAAGYTLPALMALKQVRGKVANPRIPARAKSSAAYRTIAADIQKMPPLLAQNLQRIFAKIQRADVGNEIGALAARLAPALVSASKITPKTLRSLDMANTYGWMAYTIYDDFLDDEGEPAMLPAANVALRKSVASFQAALPKDATFQTFAADLFHTIDAANAWEIANCRFTISNGTINIAALPDYEDLRFLYQRSITHSLPVTGVLAAAKTPAKASQAIYEAFQQYLLIRQLSDDLRDWQDDLRAGHISYVVVRLLQAGKVPSGSAQLDALTQQLERVFWQNVLPALCHDIERRGVQAKAQIAGTGVLAPQNVVSELITGIQDAAARTLSDQQQANQFLAAYRNA